MLFRSVSQSRYHAQHIEGVIRSSTEALLAMDYARALDLSESAFWDCCDFYLELVKKRAYLEGDFSSKRSALATLRWTLKVFLQLLAPYIPFMTDEVWQWYFASSECPSVHISKWPSVEAEIALSDSESYRLASAVISEIRGAKTRAGKNQKWGVEWLVIKGSPLEIEAVERVQLDIVNAGHVLDVRFYFWF